MSRLRGSRWRSSLVIGPAVDSASVQKPFTLARATAPAQQDPPAQESGRPLLHASTSDGGSPCADVAQPSAEAPVRLSAQSCRDHLARLRTLQHQCAELLSKRCQGPAASVGREAGLDESACAAAPGIATPTAAPQQRGDAGAQSRPMGLPESCATEPSAGPGPSPQTPLSQTPFSPWEGSPQLGHVRPRDDGFDITVPCLPGFGSASQPDDGALRRRRARLQQKAELILTMRQWSGACRELMTQRTLNAGSLVVR